MEVAFTTLLAIAQEELVNVQRLRVYTGVGSDMRVSSIFIMDKHVAPQKTMGKKTIVELPLAGRAMTKAMLRRTSALDGMEETYERKGKVAVRALNATSKLPKTVRHIECAGGGVSDLSPKEFA